MKKQLILFAHGSNDPKWKKPFELLEEKLKKTLGDESVSLAYLERSSPTLIETINNAKKNGVNCLKILPLFMAGGSHIENDLPKLINEMRNKYPDINIEILTPIGENPVIAETIYQVALSLFVTT